MRDRNCSCSRAPTHGPSIQIRKISPRMRVTSHCPRAVRQCRMSGEKALFHSRAVITAQDKQNVKATLIAASGKIRSSESRNDHFFGCCSYSLGDRVKARERERERERKGEKLNWRAGSLAREGYDTSVQLYNASDWLIGSNQFSFARMDADHVEIAAHRKRTPSLLPFSFSFAHRRIIIKYIQWRRAVN